MIYRKEYTMPGGGSRIIRDGTLSFVRVLRVEVEGTGFNIVQSSSPGNREVYCGTVLVGFTPTFGNLVFRDAPLEDQKVMVVYDWA